MKKSVEEKAELAKLKIDKKLQKQQQKEEKIAAKKEASAAKKEAKKEMQQQKKAAKKEIASAKKETKKELLEQKKAAKKEAAERKKTAKQEAANKIKALKSDAKQGKVASGEKTEDTKSKKKEKPAKKEKEEKGKQKSKGKSKGKGEEEQGSSGNKKKLFAGVLALVFVCGGVVGFLHFKGGNKEEEKDPYIEAYVLDDDFVTSIPSFLGESETRELPEITEEESESGKRIIYNYTGLQDADEEVRDYINFLTSEQEFVPMYDYNLDAPGGYVSVGTLSQEEGKILKLDIDYTEIDYRVMVSKTTEKLPEPKKASSGQDGSRDGALNYLTSFSAERLGLEKPVEEYKAIYDMGQSSIGNDNCYGISLYELGRAGTNEFEGKFFVSTNQSTVYRYDAMDNKYIEIEKPASLARAMEQTESNAEGSTENGEVSDDTSENEEQNSDTEEEKQESDEEESKDEEKKDKKGKKVQKGKKTDRQEQTEDE